MTTIAPGLARAFIFAGHASFKVVNPISGRELLFSIVKRQTKGGDAEIFYAYAYSVQGSRCYLGFIPAATTTQPQPRLLAGAKGDAYHPSFRVLEWLLVNLDNYGPAEVRHLGNCGRCARTLSDETSIATGIGPECARMMKIKRVAAEPTLPPNDAINAHEIYRAIHGETKLFPFRTIADCKAYVHQMTDEGLLTVDEAIEMYQAERLAGGKAS